MTDRGHSGNPSVAVRLHGFVLFWHSLFVEQAKNCYEHTKMVSGIVPEHG
jgi:hypothetical protein